MIHLNNTGQDASPLKTSKLVWDPIYRLLDIKEKLTIWEWGWCQDSLKRPIVANESETFHHYCEEFWFKTSVDILLNMTAVIPVIDDLFENYFPSLQLDNEGLPAHSTGHRGTAKVPQVIESSDKSPLTHVPHHRQRGWGNAIQASQTTERRSVDPTSTRGRF